ncbi:Bifunctional NMN adenylyltransferase/Nudix hydrolase [Planctomycetaceae bacterium]|nr:Bifunctional NMN adenylyltransferase/Nudix hydrolase [Planctomycetaceae bacterium]
MPFSYEHPRPALAVDCAVLGFDEGDLKVLLIKRGLEPFKGKWALPGGFVRMEESVDEAARRELAEETGLNGVFLEQLYTFGEVRRDPRGRTVSVAYFALVKLAEQEVKAATDAQAAQWFLADQAPVLAFDHARILETALMRLRNKVRYVPIGFELLPRNFTLTQLQHLYEAILGRALDKRNFRKKALAMGVVEATKEYEQGVSHRAARLYRFDEEKYAKLVKKGFNFEL